MAIKLGDVKWHKLTGDKVMIIAPSERDDNCWICRLTDRSTIEYYEHELQDTDPIE